MRKFIYKTFWFISILLLALLSGLFLPVTPRASKSLLAASIQKDSLMQNVDSPRIIFIGGSNLSFGLNSQMIKDSLCVNPINTGIHAGIGLIYMLNNALQYIREGDIVILIPEYEHFYGNFAYGSEELLRLIFDINTSKVKLLNAKQVIRIIPYLPKYTISKFKSKEYHNYQEDKHYSVTSFNEYGDVYTHWGLRRQVFEMARPLGNNFNHSVINKIKMFQAEVEKKHAHFYVSFPALQDLSYMCSEEQIARVESCYLKNGFRILGTSERYMIPDSMMFNTPGHLNKKGVDYRTTMLLNDFKCHVVPGQQTAITP